MGPLDWLKNKVGQGLSDVGSAISTGATDVGHAISTGFGDVEHAIGINNGPSPAQTGNISIAKPPTQSTNTSGGTLSLASSQPTQPNLSLQQGQPKRPVPFSSGVAGANPNFNATQPNLKPYTTPISKPNNPNINIKPNNSLNQVAQNKGIAGQPTINIAHTTPAPTPPPVNNQPQTHASILHDITHNPVTNAVGTGVKFVPQLAADYANTFANLGNRAAGKPDQTIQQNLNDPFSRNFVKMSGATGTNRQLGADIGQGALTIGSAGLRDFLEPAVNATAAFLAPEAAASVVGAARLGLPPASNGLNTAIRYGTNALEGGVINAGFNAAQTAGQTGASPLDVAKSIPSGFETGLAFGTGGTAASDFTKAIAPAISRVAKTASDAVQSTASNAVQALHGAIQSLPDQLRTVAMDRVSQEKPITTIPTNQLIGADLTGYSDLDPNQVEVYKQQFAAGKPVDPLLVMRGNDGGLYVEDGKNRLAAMNQLGIQNAQVKIITPEDIRAIAQGGYVRLPANSSDDLVKKAFISGTDDDSLYHGTRYDHAIDILKSGAIKASKPNSNRELITDSPNKQVSLSRQRNSGFYNGKAADVKFVIDKNRIGKTTQYVDGELKPSDYTNPSAFEAEEQYKNDIPLNAVKRIEGGPLLETEDENTLRELASQHNIPFIGFDDVEGMRGILPNKKIANTDNGSELPISSSDVKIQAPNTGNRYISISNPDVSVTKESDLQASSPIKIAQTTADSGMSPEELASLQQTSPVESINNAESLPSVGDVLKQNNPITRPTESEPSDIEAYAQGYGLTRQQAEKDYAEMAKEASATKNISKENLERFGPPMSIADRRELIATDPAQQTDHQLQFEIPLNADPRIAIAQATGYADERTALFNDVQRLAKKLDDNDKDLLYRYDNGEDINALAQEAHNPAAFLKAANSATNALDYSLAVDRLAGGATLKQSSYIPHYYNATSEEMDALGIPEDQRIKIGNEYRGYRDDSAKYHSYIEANQKAGLTPLYDNPFEAIQHYGEGGQRAITENLLLNALGRAAPDEVDRIDVRQGIGGDRMSPAAHGELPFAVSDRLNKALNNFRKAGELPGTAGRVVEKGVKIAGSITKKGLFLGSPFHQAHITENVAFASMLGGEPRAFAEGLINEVKSTGGISKNSYYNLLDHYRQDGTLQYARNMGIELPEHSPLDRFVNSYALSLAKAARRGGIEVGSQEAIDLGKVYNHLLGRENAKVEALSPTMQRLFSYFSLAPNYMRTQLSLVKEALLPKKLGGAGYDRPISLLSPGGAARSAVLGPRVLGGLAAVTAGAIIMHHFPTWQQAVNEFGLNPNNTNPNIPINAKNSKGESQVMNLPTDPLGLAFGFITDPKHFLQSRESPILSAVTKIATNTNWNGTPLVDTNKPGQWPLRIERGLENAATPIGIQNFTNFQHNPNNPNIQQGIAQEFGLRLKTNPNDPQVKANAAYFNLLSNISDNLKNSGPYGQYWAQQFASLHPANTTDASGMKYPTPYEPLSSEQKYAAYIDSSSGTPKLSPVFYADQKLNNATPGYPSSPLYKLTGTGIATNGQSAPQALVALEYEHAQDPAAKTDIMNANGGQNGWLAKYEGDVANNSQNYQANLTKYFQGLGWTQTAINNYWQHHPSTPDPVATPTFDQKTTDLMNQYYALSASGDSTSASQFFSQNAGVLGNAFDQLAQHANALRQDKGELALQGYPAESDHVQQVLNSMPSGSDSASKKARATLISSNPDVSQYLADIALYEALDKGAQFRYVNPANTAATEGENINASGKTGQTFLKDTASLGKYDIGSNGAGQYMFMQNGGFTPGFSISSSGSGSSKKPLVPLPPRQKRPPKRSSHKIRIQKETARHVHLKKTHLSPIAIKHGGPLQASNVINIKS